MVKQILNDDMRPIASLASWESNPPERNFWDVDVIIRAS